MRPHHDRPVGAESHYNAIWKRIRTTMDTDSTDIATGPTGVGDLDRLIASMLSPEQIGHLVRDEGLTHVLTPRMWYERLCRELKVPIDQPSHGVTCYEVPYDASLNWRFIYHTLTCRPVYGRHRRDEVYMRTNVGNGGGSSWATTNLTRRVCRLVRGLREPGKGEMQTSPGELSDPIGGSIIPISNHTSPDHTPRLHHSQWSPAALAAIGPLLRAMVEDTLHTYLKHIESDDDPSPDERLYLWQKVTLAVAKEGCSEFIEKVIDGHERMYGNVVTPTFWSCDMAENCTVLDGPAPVVWTLKALLGLLYSPHSNVEVTSCLWDRWFKHYRHIASYAPKRWSGGRTDRDIPWIMASTAGWITIAIHEYVDDMSCVTQHTINLLSRCPDGAQRLVLAMRTLLHLPTTRGSGPGGVVYCNRYPVYNFITGVMSLSPLSGEILLHRPTVWVRDVMGALLESIGKMPGLSPLSFTDDIDNTFTTAMLNTIYDKSTADAFVATISQCIKPFVQAHQIGNHAMPYTRRCYRAFCDGVGGVGVDYRADEYGASDNEQRDISAPVTAPILRERIQKMYVERWTDEGEMDGSVGVYYIALGGSEAALYCRGLVLYYGQMVLDTKRVGGEWLTISLDIFAQVCAAIASVLGPRVWRVVIATAATLDLTLLEQALDALHSVMSIDNYTHGLHEQVYALIEHRWNGDGPVLGRGCMECLLDRLDALVGKWNPTDADLTRLGKLLKRAVRWASCDWDTLEYTLRMCVQCVSDNRSHIVKLRALKEASFIFYGAPLRVVDLLRTVLLEPSSTSKERMEAIEPYMWGSM